MSAHARMRSTNRLKAKHATSVLCWRFQAFDRPGSARQDQVTVRSVLWWCRFWCLGVLYAAASCYPAAMPHYFWFVWLLIVCMFFFTNWVVYSVVNPTFPQFDLNQMAFSF